MFSDRFHKAAKDGLLDVLKEATRKEANAKDGDSMTPVLWAAFEGNLDALRLLCGRGGDPDKCDEFGNTALHLASAKGHLSCVDFLVKFGGNIYALDIDRHSAKDLAAINNRDDILRYLDAATANFEANNRKKSKTLRELAEKGCEKRMREYRKRQQKLESEYMDTHKPSTSNDSRAGTTSTTYGCSTSNKQNMLSTIKQKIWSSQGNINKPVKEAVGHSNFTGSKFSELVGWSSSGSVGSIASRAGTVQKQSISKNGNFEDTGFKIGEIESDGTRTVTSLMGLQRDSEILYVGTFNSNEENTKRGKISDVFEVNEAKETERDPSRLGYGTLTRSFSQPDFLTDTNVSPSGRLCEELTMQRPAGLFARPMLGSIAFRRSVTAALTQLHPDSCSPDMDSNSSSAMLRKAGTMQKLHNSKSRLFLNISDSDSDGADGYSEDELDTSGTPIQRFLAAWGLDEYLTIFQKQQIDLDTLMLLTEPDLKSLGLPLGPFRKLTCAIQERRHALSSPGAMHDSRL